MNSIQNQHIEELTLKVIFLRLLSRWYLFFLFSGLFLAAAFVYLQDTPRKFKAQAALLINDNKVDRSKGREFMNEIGLFDPNEKKEDEVGILKSYTLLAQTAKSLDMGVSYQKKGLLRYYSISANDCPIYIRVDSSSLQVVNTPLELTYQGNESFLVEGKAAEATVFQLKTQEPNTLIPDWAVNGTVTSGASFDQNNLKFDLFIKDANLLEVGDTYKVVLQTLESQVLSLEEKLEVAPLEEEGNLIQLTTEGFSIKDEKKFLNTLIENYLKKEQGRRSTEGNKIISLIDKQIEEVADSLRTVEDMLESFRSESKIVDIGTASEELTKRVLDLEKDLSRVNGENQYYRQIEDYFAQAQRGEQLLAPSALDISDPMMNPLLNQLSELYQERAKLLQSAKPGNPQLQRLEKEIQNVTERLAENAKNRVAASDIQLTQIKQNIASTRSQLNRLPGNEKQLNRLEREFTLIEKNYQYLLEKKSEANIALANTSDDKYVVDQARQLGDKPTSPNSLLVYFMALAAGLGVPLGIILLINTVDDKIKGLRDIRLHTKIPVIGVILFNNEKIRLLTSKYVSTPLAESFRTIRMHVRDLLPNMKCRVIGVTSTWSGEGKTFCAANLASMMAQSGYKVLIMDVDLRKADLHKNFKLKNERGLSGFLQGRESLENILVETEISNLFLIPAGPVDFHSVDLLEGKSFSSLMTELKGIFDFIIFDTPPIGETPDYILLKEFIDLTLYIVRHGKTTTPSLGRINDLYDSGRLKNIQIVVNDVSQKQSYGLGDDTFGYGTKIGYYQTAGKKKVGKFF
ncbi:MAG: polysaccharide biosynthesis tyrosine autokinase [Bacteroidota bacterium]